MNNNQMVTQIGNTKNMRAQFSHMRSQPLYSTINLRGRVDGNGVVQPQKISWFETKVNGRGQGFDDRMLHRGLTNFTGSGNRVPSGFRYVALAAGVRFLTPPDIVTPRHVIQKLCSGSTSIEVRLGDSTAYNLGALEFLPAGRFGYSSRSVAVLGEAPQNGDMTLIDYPQNGDSGLKVFPAGSEMRFNPNSLIEVNLEIHEAIVLTDDGQPSSDPNDHRDCWIQFIFDGYSQDNVEG